MPYQFLQHLIVRCPALSYRDYHPDNLSDLLKSDLFLSALYLSNPQFYHILERKHFDVAKLEVKERLTLQNYYNRMSFRTTPFGAFSSFTYTTWDDEGTETINLSSPTLYLLPDQHYLKILLSQKLSAYTCNEPLFVNPTLYKQRDGFKFVKTNTSPNETAYNYALTSFSTDGILSGLIKKFSGRSVNLTDLATYVTGIAGCDNEEAISYLTYLAESGILIGKTLPSTLSAEIKSTVLSGVPNIQSIKQIHSKLANDIAYQDQKALKNFFYTNLQAFTSDKLSIDYRQKLSKVIDALQTLVPFPGAANMQEFADAFEKRFERQAISLLQVLDPITGIGYGNSSQDNEATLLNGIDLNKGQAQVSQITWTKVHGLLLKKISTATNCFIEITDADLDWLKHNRMDEGRLPASMAVLFNIADDQLIVDTVGGVSGNGLIGRFTSFDEEILRAAKTVAETEQRNNSDVIFAEINHLADSHTDNINRRLPIYEYEILINILPTPGIKQLPLNDLHVLSKNGEALLWSKRLKKRIIPRFTSAYNHQRNDLNIFRFLSDLQYQNVRYDLDFSLAKFFPGLDHYPRVVYDGSIISLASWTLPTEVIKSAATNSPEKLSILRIYLKDNNIPATIALGYADKQLYFNLDDDAQAVLFIENIKTLDKVTITEFILPKTTAVKKDDKYLLNQFVAFVANTETTYPGIANVNFVNSKIIRGFAPGSEWLYLKIYCSPLAADELLALTIAPLMQKMLKVSDSYKWFFIRYHENGSHIRLRVNCKKELVGTVLTQLQSAFAKIDTVKDYQVSTYQRELERYGSDIIEDVEDLFFKSSVVITAYLKSLIDVEHSLPYYAFGFISVLRLVKIFLPDLSEQVDFTDNVVANFIKEYTGGKELKVGLDKKYREISSQISGLYNDTQFFKTLNIAKQQKEYEMAFAELLNKLKNATIKRRRQLAADIIHMHINRTFADRQRDHEMVLYYCLTKKLRSDLARQKT